MKWTNSQQQAIESRGQNLLVSAAAGSGKTAVLVQRIIDIILIEKVEVQNLLIVTFTNAAAAEMKERIQKKLMEKIIENPNDIQYLTRQIQNLPRASISTMHSFCIDILRRNFHILNIDPSFKIASASLTQIMKSQAMDELLEQAYDKSDEGFLALVDSYSGTKNDYKIIELILSVYEFIQSQPFPLQWLKEQVDMFDIKNNEELEASKWVNIITNDIKLTLEDALNSVDLAIELCLRENGPLLYLAALEDDKKHILNLMELAKGPLNEINLYLKDLKYERLSPISKAKKDDYDISLVEEVKSIRDTNIKENGINFIKKILSKISSSSTLEDIQNIHPILVALYEIVSKFEELYLELKKSNSVLDFSDLEHFALKLLTDANVRADLRAKYSHIFFDEYQDSNIVQETIISAIKREDNLFLVGDVKQSIYRFRLADPTLFIEKYLSYSLEENKLNKRIDLSSNYRSRPAILDFINDIFSNLMSKELGEVDYDNAAKLVPGMNFPTENDKVELVLLENDKIQEDELYLEQDIQNSELEAIYVAKRIKELIGTSYFNPKAQNHINITYRDIVILMRSPRNSIASFEEVLKENRIPFYIDFSSSYYDVLEVKLFISLLKIIDNIQQDESLLAVMYSSIGGFSLNEIIEIRTAYKDNTIYQAITEFSQVESNELASKLNIFLDKIKNYKFKQSLMHLDEFLWYLMTETGFYNDILAMPGGKARQENLRALIDKAAEFQSNTTNSLFNFLHYIEKLLKDKGDTQEAKGLSDSENRVRIMSIHKSKGLEFPVVFVCGLSKRFNQEDFKKNIILHNKLGLGPKYVDLEKNIYRDTLSKTAIKLELKKELLSEEMRILYVALTRAIDTLIMVGTVKNLEKFALKVSKTKSIRYLMNQMDYISWIFIALYSHINLYSLRSLIDKDSVYPEDTSFNSNFKLNLISKYDLIKFTRKEKQEINEIEEIVRNYNEKFNQDINMEIINLANNRFSYVYPYAENTTTLVKTTATSLAKSNVQESIRNIEIKTIPRFMQEMLKLSSAHKGIAMHFVMQNLELSKVDSINSINNQIDMMYVNELLTLEERNIIDVKALYNFFLSNLGTRLLNSDNIKRENSFLLKKDETLVGGIIDLYFEEDGKWILLDYKTDYIRIGSQNEKADLYRPQLEIYKQALEQSTDKLVKNAYIYLFDINETIEVL